MNGKVMLDTNIVIALFNQESSVVEFLSQQSEIYLPIMVIGELFFGAMRSSRLSENLNSIELFSSECRLIYPDNRSSFLYAQIKTELAAKGKPIPENDVWIAACASQHGLPLVTRDNHFSDIASIQLIQV